MKPLQQHFQAGFQYPVHFTSEVFSPGNPLLKTVITEAGGPLPAKALIVVDQGVIQQRPALREAITAYGHAHPSALRLVAPPLVVPGGEQVKNDPRHVAEVHAAISRGGICRHSYVIVVGGGAVLDMAGYAAATAHRGVRVIRVPTTVLAQSDSAVGVKNGINALGKKNFLGTFAPPFAVLNDFSFLASLEDRDWRSGIAEAIKVGLVKDAGFFGFIEANAIALAARKKEPMHRLIYRCAELHLQHIAAGGDPFEQGTSRPLDFGHWAAHKLEQLSDYRIRHGEAVAIGIALDTTYSCLAGYLPEAEGQRVLNVLTAVGFHLYVPDLSEALEQPGAPRHFLNGLEEFREHLGGELTIMLLKQPIGQGFEVHHIDRARMRDAIIRLKQEGELARSTPGGSTWGKNPALAH